MPGDAPSSLSDLRAQLERLLAAGRFAAGLPLAERYAALAPDDTAAWTLLGASLRGSFRPAPAAAAYRRALEIMPDSPALLSNLGNALTDLHRLDEAMAAHHRALQKDPRNATTWRNLGVVLRERGDLDDALAAFGHVLALAPGDAAARIDRAVIRLARGEFASAWQDFEWRWRLPENPPPDYGRPQWTGAAQPEGTILLWAEQGIGEVLVGARYVPLVKERFGTVLVGCSRELARLLGAMPGIDRVVTPDDALPEFDHQCPLLSLPSLFETTPETIPLPAAAPLPPESQARLGAQIQAADRHLKVGIAWAGDAGAPTDTPPDMIERFLGFAELPGIRLFSVQPGPRAADLAACGAAGLVADLAPHLGDFADAAAAVDALDLIVTTDTPIAHLAGARGRPVWNLLAFTPHWLYFRDRPDTPWYPSMRLFRQPRPGDWAPVFGAAKAALAALAAERGVGA